MQKESIIHTVHVSEREAFTYHVNEVLRNDADVRGKLPIAPDQILNLVEDGVILW